MNTDATYDFSGFTEDESIRAEVEIYRQISLRAIPVVEGKMLATIMLTTFPRKKQLLVIEPGGFLKFWTDHLHRDKAAVSRAMQWLKEKNIVIECPAYSFLVNPVFADWTAPMEPEAEGWANYHVTSELPPDLLDRIVIMREKFIRSAKALSSPVAESSAAGGQVRPLPGSCADQGDRGDKRGDSSKRTPTGPQPPPSVAPMAVFSLPVHFESDGQALPAQEKTGSNPKPDSDSGKIKSVAGTGPGTHTIVLKTTGQPSAPATKVVLKTTDQTPPAASPPHTPPLRKRLTDDKRLTVHRLTALAACLPSGIPLRRNEILPAEERRLMEWIENEVGKDDMAGWGGTWRLAIRALDQSIIEENLGWLRQKKELASRGAYEFDNTHGGWLMGHVGKSAGMKVGDLVVTARKLFGWK